MRLLCALLLFSTSLASAGELWIGGGKLANNANRQHPGWVYDLAYRAGPIQVSASRVTDSYMGAELNVSAIYRLERGRWHIGGGVIVAHSYEVPDYWFSDSNADPFLKFGLKAQCMFCGTAVQAGYAITPRLELQIRYWATERFIIPSHNGVLAVIGYRL